MFCDVINMDDYHVLFGRPLMYDREVHHYGVINTYQFVKDYRCLRLFPMLEESMEKGIVMCFYKESLRKEEFYPMHFTNNVKEIGKEHVPMDV